MNINNNITIEYDANILYRIKEMLKTGLIKFKSNVISKQDFKFNVFHEIYENSGEFSEKEMYKIHEHLMVCLIKFFSDSNIPLAFSVIYD